MNNLSIIQDIKNVLQIAILCIVFTTSAQQLKVPDSLIKKNYKTLDSLYYINEYTEKGKLYISAYLKKAKLENNLKETLNGYHHLADFYDTNYEIATRYIDSAINLTKNRNYKDNYYPAALYGKKSTIERIEGNFQNALYFLLKDLELGDYDPDGVQMTYLNHNIGLIKRDYGDFEGAKSIFKKNLKFDRDYLKENPNDDRGYFDSSILSIYELVRTFRLNREIDSAKILNDEGLKIGVDSLLGYLLILNDGILDYYNEDYKVSIDKITSILSKISDVNNRYDYEIYNLIDAYFYLGKSYEGIDNQEQKLVYFKKIDSLAETSNYLTPEIKLTYLQLVKHYKGLGDEKKQLKYLDKLITVDSILDNNYKYINDKLETDYDIPNLIKGKESLIDTLKNENVKTAKKGLLISIFLAISFVGIGFLYFRQRRYKRKFQKLLAKSDMETQDKIIIQNKDKLSVDISKETVVHITKSLQKFEEKENYLKANLTCR